MTNYEAVPSPDCDRNPLTWVKDDTEEEDVWEDADGPVPVKFYTHEMSIRGRLRRFLIRNPKSRLGSTVLDLVVKVIISFLYVVRVCLDNHAHYACWGEPCSANVTSEQSKEIYWYPLIWVDRPTWLWILEVVLCCTTLAKAILHVYVTNKGTRLNNVLQTWFLLEVFCSLPMILTVTYPALLRNLWVPCFFTCWHARLALEKLLNDLHLTRQRFQTISVTLSQRLLLLNVTIFCLIFTTICGIQHIQRGSSDTPLSMFQAIYFVIVTFSTVGYGDIYPDIWLGRLFMMIMICVAFAFIPRQLEAIGSIWMERQKSGGEFSKAEARQHRHVVVCSSLLTIDTVMSFLNEFFSHPKLEEHSVVLLSAAELDTRVQTVLKDAKWTHRVLYMRGSALKDVDLKRCRIQEAEACFFLQEKTCGDRNKADQYTILRSWAVKDYAPNCKQYIQLHEAENKMHVKFAEHVVCNDEFKYALLANNCLYPGLSTFVTLLLHTSRGREGELARESWQQVYGRHSGNEVYHIQLGRSAFFKRYEGKKFTEASADAHERYGVGLVGVLDVLREVQCLQLNPGPDYVLKATDFCFYMSLTKEEYSTIKDCGTEADVSTSAKRNKNIEMIATEIQKWLQSEGEEERGDEESVFSTITSQMGNPLARNLKYLSERVPLLPYADDDVESGSGPNTAMAGTETLERPDTCLPGKLLHLHPDMGQETYTTGPPPSAMFVGTKRTSCHLHKQPRPLCCLLWGQDCEHCTYKNARDERWNAQLIILTTETATPGLYNFLVPLRSDWLGLGSLLPIVLLLENEPSTVFLETVAHFPMVYWMKGKLSNLDDLLVAGVSKASHLVLANRDVHLDPSEETLADAEVVVAVQKIYKLFPSANIITVLNDASNMRFMQFRAHDAYTQEISKLEKKLKEEINSNLPHLFRLPFAAGQVFSCGMLDRLLYQTYVKGYLINFVRLLLGVDAEQNSGHLSSVRVTRPTLAQFPAYKDLYRGLSSTTGEIPIAIYRRERRAPFVTVSNHDSDLASDNNNEEILQHHPSSLSRRLFAGPDKDNADAAELINNRLQSLGLAGEEIYDEEFYEMDTPQNPENDLYYVIVNPSPHRKLKCGDTIYVIQPSSMNAIPNKLKWRKPRLTGSRSLPPGQDLTPERNARVSWNLGQGGGGKRRGSANAATSPTPASALTDKERRRNKSECQT